MKIAVCEDSPADMKLLKPALTEAAAQLRLSLETDFYRSGEELISAVQGGLFYPLIFLDIYMGDLNGIQTARALRALLPEVQLAFLTSSREFMLEAFDLNALHYLPKPVDTPKLRECLERFLERGKLPPELLEIRSELKTYTFPLAQIRKIISSNKGVDIFLQESEVRHLPLSFIKVEEQLDPGLFLKLSRGFIVQMSYILCIDKDICRLKDGTEVLISRQSWAEIRKKYNDYLFHA